MRLHPDLSVSHTEPIKVHHFLPTAAATNQLDDSVNPSRELEKMRLKRADQLITINQIQEPANTPHANVPTLDFADTTAIIVEYSLTHGASSTKHKVHADLSKPNLAELHARFRRRTDYERWFKNVSPKLRMFTATTFGSISDDLKAMLKAVANASAGGSGGKAAVAAQTHILRRALLSRMQVRRGALEAETGTAAQAIHHAAADF